MSAASRRWAAATALVAVLVAVQALSGAAAVSSDGGPGRMAGETGFAYLYGLRSYAAALLWSGIDPLYHEYYADKELSQLVELIPTMRMVQLLDPQLEQPYYVASWTVARRGDVATGLDIARDGVENNPDSGLLRANYAQLLLTVAHDPKAAREQAETAMRSPTTKWGTVADLYDGLAVFAAVYDVTGDTEAEKAVREIMDDLRAKYPAEELSGEHEDEHGE